MGCFAWGERIANITILLTKLFLPACAITFTHHKKLEWSLVIRFFVAIGFILGEA